MDTRVIYPVNFALIALAFGIWGDLMLRALPLGVNVPLWYIPLVIVIPIVYREKLTLIQPITWLFLAFSVVLSMVPFVRDSGVLNALCLLAALVALWVAAAKQTGLLLWAAGASGYGLHMITTLFDSAFSWMKHIRLVESWWADRAPRSHHHTPAILRGIGVSIPILIVFGILFSSADARYERIVMNVSNIDPTTFLKHSFFICAFSWAASALLLLFFFPSLHGRRAENEESTDQKWDIESLIVLFAINLVFVSYVVIQVSYFFGGLEHMLAVEGLTVAEYARRGFFEAATAAALVIAIVLGLSEKRSTDHPAQDWVFKFLSMMLVGLTCVVVASGVQRILVYQGVFGLTEDRFYVFAILVWMLGTLAWLGFTLLVHRLRGFVVGSMVWGYVCLFFVAGLNPHHQIASINLARAADGRELDADYLTSLSADASRVLYVALPTLSVRNQQIIGQRMRQRSAAIEDEDFRSWCIARQVLKNTPWPEAGQRFGEALSSRR